MRLGKVALIIPEVLNLFEPCQKSLPNFTLAKKFTTTKPFEKKFTTNFFQKSKSLVNFFLNYHNSSDYFENFLINFFKKFTTVVVNFLRKLLAPTQNFSRANKFGVRARLRTPALNLKKPQSRE